MSKFKENTCQRCFRDFLSAGASKFCYECHRIILNTKNKRVKKKK